MSERHDAGQGPEPAEAFDSHPDYQPEPDFFDLEGEDDEEGAPEPVGDDDEDEDEEPAGG